MNEHEKIAAVVFHQYGLDFKDAERAGGFTNAVWLNGDFALRLSLRKDGDIIRREVMRSKALPLSVGYPRSIAIGVTDGYEWSLSERVQGKILSEVWNTLNWTEKTATIKQIADIMNVVHSVEVSSVEHLTLKKAWYNSFDKNESIADIERYEEKKIFTQEQCFVLREILEKFYKWNACATPVLCHGDITMDNLLWREGSIISLLDFEHSVIAPRQLDVHSLVNMALIPYDETALMDIILITEKGHEVQQYAANMISLLSPYLSNQGEKDLFVGYNVLFRQRFLEFWLENPKGKIEQCDAYQKLLSLSDGRYGYLSRLINGR